MELVVQPRNQFGRAVKVLRHKGLIPAELYGHGIQNVHVSVPVKDFRKTLKSAGESTVITLVVGADKHPVMIHDVSHDPVTDEVTSVDFYRVNLEEKIKVKVPFEFTGESPAVKNLGGLLIKAMNEIEIEALPMDVPRSIEVSIQSLAEINQSLYVKDISFGKGIKVSVDGATVIATVTAKMTEEEEQKLAAEGAKLEDVKVESEEKKAERDAAKTEGTTDTPASAEPAPKK